MRRPVCHDGTPAAVRAWWPLVGLAVVSLVACAGGSRQHRTAKTVAEDTTTVAQPARGVQETPLPVAPPEPNETWVRLRGTTVEQLGSTHRLVFDLSRVPDSVKHFRLPKPPRLVLDIAGPHKPAHTVDRYPIDDPIVQGVRVGHYSGRMRLVVDLRGEPPETYTVKEEGNALVVYMGNLADQLVGWPVSSRKEHGGAEQAATSPDGSPVAASPEGQTPVRAPGDPPARADAPALASDDAPAIDEEPYDRPVEPESPAVPEPKLLEESPPRLARLTEMSPGGKTYVGRRISLDFKDAEVQNVLRVIADVSGLNIVATDDVTGRITLHLVDVPWDQALDVVLGANSLKMVREGQVVRISTVDRVREEQEALRAQELAAKELEPLQVQYVRVNYARADKSLLDKVQGILTDRGSASFDERTNTIIIRDIGRGVADAVELFYNLDVQSPQVLIEANIVEGTSDFSRALGIQWGYRHLAGPETGNPTGQNFPGTVDFSGGGLGLGKPAPSTGGGAPQPLVPLMADFPVPSNFGPGFGPGSGSAFDLALGSLSGSDTLAARITALEEQGKGKIISRPRVITLNNIPAMIQSLTILRVRLPSTGTVVNTGTGGVAGSASSATEKIETGIILIVTPQVSADGFVLMNIKTKTSQADFSRTVDEIPTEIAREATSNVLIQDGETVVLGGIFRNEANDTETGLPFLRSIPGVGWLFKRMLRRDRKDELLVFITPQVVAGYNQGLPSASELWENRGG